MCITYWVVGAVHSGPEVAFSAAAAGMLPLQSANKGSCVVRHICAPLLAATTLCSIGCCCWLQVKSLEDSTPNIDAMLRDAKTALKKSKRVDYYKLLEIDQNAGDADVKKAYRRAAFKYHPDKASSEDREENEKKFKLVGQAHAILSEPAKRQKYDAGWSAEEIDQGMQMGEDGTYGHGGGHGANMDDVFAHMFAGGMFGGGMPGGMGGGMGGGGRPGYSRRPGGFSGF